MRLTAQLVIRLKQCVEASLMVQWAKFLALFDDIVQKRLQSTKVPGALG